MSDDPPRFSPDHHSVFLRAPAGTSISAALAAVAQEFVATDPQIPRPVKVRFAMSVDPSETAWEPPPAQPDLDDPAVHRIDLGDGSFALVDTADRDLTLGFNWYRNVEGYVQANRGTAAHFLHRLIAGAGDTDVVDHWNMDPLDNRTVNLRKCRRGLNSANRNADRRRAGKTSRYKGVWWEKTRNRWVAKIEANGKVKQLGRFDDEDEAARAYDKAAIEAWGPFARLNLPPTGGDAQ